MRFLVPDGLKPGDVFTVSQPSLVVTPGLNWIPWRRGVSEPFHAGKSPKLHKLLAKSLQGIYDIYIYIIYDVYKCVYRYNIYKYIFIVILYMFQGSGILRKVPSKCQPGQLVAFLGIGSCEGKWLCAKTPVANGSRVQPRAPLGPRMSTRGSPRGQFLVSPSLCSFRRELKLTCPLASPRCLGEGELLSQI